MKFAWTAAALLLVSSACAQVNDVGGSIDRDGSIREAVSSEELEQRLKNGSWVHVSAHLLQQLLDRYESSKQPSESPVRSAEYRAVLADRTLSEGTLDLTLRPPRSTGKRPLSLGETNLSRLRLYSDGIPLTLAADAQGNLLPLTAPVSTGITGTWSLGGERSGASTVFQLRLPSASVAVFRLHTNGDTTVTSTNALVVLESRTREAAEWVIYPKNPSVLAITTTTLERPGQQDDFTVSLTTDIRLDVASAKAVWEATVPQALSGAGLSLLLSRPCEIQRVRSGGTDLNWRYDQTSRRLSIELPVFSKFGTLTIDASVPQGGSDHAELPFLLPETWHFKMTDSRGRMDVRFGRMRLSVAPELVITELQLEGVQQDDVSFASDGSPTLELRPFSRTAAATVRLATARPVVADSVVIKVGTGDESESARAFLFLESLAGTFGRAVWQIPKSWRVTDVRESATGVPVLFRMHDAAADQETATVDLVLRSPVTTDAGLALEAVLQSTARGTYVPPVLPQFVNPDYHRRVDLLCLDADTAPAETGWPNADIVARPQGASWLPDELDDQVTFFSRPSERDRSDVITESQDELYSTVEYSVSTTSDRVNERTRIRLRTSGVFPPQIPLRVSNGTDIRLSDETTVRPLPLLRRRATEAGAWMLELSSETLAVGEIEFTLLTQRIPDETLAVTLISVEGSQLTGGKIHPPSDDDRILLQSGELISETYPYPVAPYADEWLLRRSDVGATEFSVAGIVFARIHQVDGGFATDTLQQLSVTSTGLRSQLSVAVPEADEYRVYVDGKPVFAEPLDGLMEIPLREGLPDPSVVICWSQRSADRDFRVHVADCPDASRSSMQCFVLPPVGFEPQPAPHETLRAPGAVSEMLAAVGGLDPSPEAEDARAAFEYRWQLQAASLGQVLCTTAADGAAVLSLRQSRFDRVWSIGWALVFFLMWMRTDPQSSVGRWLPGAITVIVSILPAALTSEVENLCFGLMAGSLAAGLVRLPMWFVGARRSTASSGTTSARLVHTSVLLLCIGAGTAHAQDSSTPARILVPRVADGQPEYVYVEQAFLDELRGALTATEDESVVVSSDVHITLESPQSALMKVRCVVACDPSFDSGLTIPLDGMTLIESSLDGEGAFPERAESGDSVLKISVRAMVPDRRLSTDPESLRTAGPDTYGGWDLRHIEYTVRTVPRRSPDAYRLEATLPPSATASVRFTDRAGVVEQPETAGSPSAARLQPDGSWIFPREFNTRSVDLILRRNAGDADTATAEQQCAMVCVSDLSPARQRITCEYRVRPQDRRIDKVVVGTDPRYRIVQIETPEGDALPWSLSDAELHVSVLPNADGVQSFVIQLLHEPATSLRHDIPIGSLSRVNGRRCDLSAFFADPSDRFAVSSVETGDVALEDLPVTNAVGDFSVVRGADRMFLIPPSEQTVAVTLEEIPASTTAVLTQQVVVSDSRIRWNGRFEFDVSGQPVFRQIVRLSPDLQVFDVTARGGDVSLLQSWTRHDDQVVISLREATRGRLDVEIRGVLQRVPNRDTRLPAIGLPSSIRITESVLDLSTSSEVDTFIRNPGAAEAGETIDYDRDPIPAAPLRFRVRDISQPLTIQGNANKLIVADIVVFVYDAGGESRFAQLLKLKTPEADFDIRFSCALSEFGDIAPVLVRGTSVAGADSAGSGWVIPRSDATDTVVLVLPELLAAVAGDELICRIPEFEARTEIDSCVVCDLRNEASTTALSDSSLAWALNAAALAGISDHSSAVQEIESRLEPDLRRIRIQPTGNTAAPDVVADAGGLFRVHSQHLLSLAEDGSILGRSGFVVFRSRDRTLLLEFPPDGVLVRCTVDGRPLGTTVVDGTVEIKVPGKTAFVELTWLTSRSSGQFSTERTVQLPHFAAPEYVASAVVVPPERRPLVWSVSNSVSLADARDARHRGFRRGLELVSDRMTPTSPASPEFSEREREQQLWDQMTAVSLSAGTTAARFFRRVDHVAGRFAAVAAPDRGNHITIRYFPRPSASRYLPFLAGLSILAGCWILKRRERQPASPDSPVT